MGINCWTIAYRKPRASTMHRVTDWSGTWSQARNLGGLVKRAHPELDVWYTPSRTCEQAHYHVCSEDQGNILVDSGRRVRLIDNGHITNVVDDAILATFGDWSGQLESWRDSHDACGHLSVNDETLRMCDMREAVKINAADDQYVAWLCAHVHCPHTLDQGDMLACDRDQANLDGRQAISWQHANYGLYGSGLGGRVTIMLSAIVRDNRVLGFGTAYIDVYSSDPEAIGARPAEDLLLSSLPAVSWPAGVADVKRYVADIAMIHARKVIGEADLYPLAGVWAA